MTVGAEPSERGRWRLPGALMLVLVVSYVAWLGWRRDGDPQTHQVAGAVATAALVTAIASWSSVRPSRTANIAFWWLLVVNAADMGLVGGENLWPVSALLLGPWVWLALRLPALGIEKRRHGRAPTDVTSPPRPSQPRVVPDTDAQIAAWRAHRRTFDPP